MPDDASTAAAWTATFAARLGVDPPSDEQVELLLDLAGVAAHASERTAAPIACWLVGQSGMAPAAALEVAREV